MAKFTAVPNLDQVVAEMIAPAVADVAKRAETLAKQYAPPMKVWQTMQDARVRPEHRAAQGQQRPGNLRFAINSHDWDRKHRGLGPLTYMNMPRDESSRAVVNIKNCRCRAETDPDGIAKLINTTPVQITGTKVTATVVCKGNWVVQAEYGTVYPGDLTAPGALFMTRAAAQTAAGRRFR